MTSLTPSNQLNTVRTWQSADVALLQNSYCGINMTNKKFNNFQNFIANLGDTVNYNAPYRFRSFPSLVITKQPTVQRVESLTCSQTYNSAISYTNQQLLFNIDQYLNEIGKDAIAELGATVETDLLLNFIGQMQVQDTQASNFGTVYTNNGGFRFFGDGVSNIATYQQFQQAVENFKNFGSSMKKMRMVFPNTVQPLVIGNGLNQFAPTRNDKDAMSWSVGTFGGVDYSTSNLLPIHVSGTIGDAASPNNLLTVVSTNDPTGQNITEITCTEPTSGTDPNAIKIGDLGVFIPNVSGKPNLYFRHFIGHTVSQQPVQFFITNDAATTSGTVTIKIRTINGVGLVWAANANQNLNVPIQAGMKIKIMPSHLAGNLDSGDQFYLSMPRLPDQPPYATSTEQDKESGASLRHYYGAAFGENNLSYVRDLIFGAGLLPDNSMRMLFSLTSN